MEEEWRDIKGYEGRYQISSLGRVYSFYKKDILKLAKHTGGYLQIGLYKDGKSKTLTVHKLVAEAFIPNPNNYKEINHKDENKQSNCVDNLEWCDRKYNLNYGTAKDRMIRTQKRNGKTKGSKSPSSRKVQCITTGRKFNCIKEAAEYYCINSYTNITMCCQGKKKSAGKNPDTGEKLVWKYID